MAQQKRVMNSVEINMLGDSQLEILIFKQYLTIPGKRHTEIDLNGIRLLLNYTMVVRKHSGVYAI